MHTSRNRLARKSRSGAKPPTSRSPRHDQTFMLREGAPQPPAFPADLIVPAHRGAMITAVAWPADAIPAPAETRIKPASPLRPGLSRKAAKKVARRAAAIARAQSPNKPGRADHAPAGVPYRAVAGQRPAAPPLQPDPAKPDSVPVLAVRPALVAAMPLSAVDRHMLHATEPLPAARALVARRQGFVDILALLLRDSGRRLCRWSSAKRRADDMKLKLAKAEARMRAMEAQLAALQALQASLRQP